MFARHVARFAVGSLFALVGLAASAPAQELGHEGVDLSGPMSGSGCAWKPRYTVEAGPVWMLRSGPQRNTELGRIVNFTTGETLQRFGTESIDYPWEVGATATLRFHNAGCGTSLDFRWLGLDSWLGRSSLNTTEGNPIGTRTPISPVDFVLQEGAEEGGVAARTHGYLQSLQIGRSSTWVDNDDRTASGYFGFRYMYFRDSIDAVRAGDLDNETYGVGGNNNLLGLETGLDVGEHFGFMTFGFRGKVGVYGNLANVHGRYALNISSVENFAPIGIQDIRENVFTASTSVDFGLYSTIHCNKNFAVRFGYDFLWLTGLALGSEHLQPNLIVATRDGDGTLLIGPGKLDANARTNTIFHALSATAEFTW